MYVYSGDTTETYAVRIQMTGDDMTDSATEPTTDSATPATMRAIAQDRYGDPEVLELRTVDVPSIDPDEVLIRVHAGSVNPLDWHMMTGTPALMRLTVGLRAPKQRVRGADVAGVIERVGSDVTEFVPGDRVVGGARGSFAEFAVSRPRNLITIPEGLGFGEAAALPVAAITALEALRDQARTTSGQRVLVNGAAGGVGTFAVQLAAAMGADVTGVCSGRNVELVRSLGANHVVDYGTADFVDAGPFDAIVDNVGNRSFGDIRRALTDDGVYVMVSGPKGKLIRPVDRMIAGMLRFRFGSQRFAGFTATESAENLTDLAGYIERGDVRPVIERVYPLAETADAMRYLATGHARAKLVVEVVPGAGVVTLTD